MSPHIRFFKFPDSLSPLQKICREEEERVRSKTVRLCTRGDLYRKIKRWAELFIRVWSVCRGCVVVESRQSVPVVVVPKSTTPP